MTFDPVPPMSLDKAVVIATDDAIIRLSSIYPSILPGCTEFRR